MARLVFSNRLCKVFSGLSLGGKLTCLSLSIYLPPELRGPRSKAEKGQGLPCFSDYKMHQTIRRTKVLEEENRKKKLKKRCGKILNNIL